MPAAASPRVCVYCGSSPACDAAFLEGARRLGRVLADAGIGVVYGGGGIGSMGELAEGVLERGGKITGVIPRFMIELEWAHSRLEELQVVEDMRTRKHLMLEGSAAAIALPGGCGTFEELMEAITLKRLGIYLQPIVLVNQRGYFDPLITMLERAAAEHFMADKHLQMWTVVDEPEDAPAAIADAPAWDADARRFANLRDQA
ncbi:LOG family protein YvdD [Posidoniimonas polymericola]|uniref:Cytokinin riboside 5'-monophosphate phosphoribohydrolase n=1 Tax=Posidoniimonas polymericola TaxID=2528002 RepID=A0A5C5YR31_9BACT|nr:TIGR00730 family Rossman fold protein [Posidoniimonas polymericola]TWT77402.1 LOG family protein YvdD [Posidoniimonas polymericola]